MTRAVKTSMVVAEISVRLSTSMERCDYGVPRSPVWYEPGDIYVDEIEFDGVTYTESEFAEKFGEKFASYVIEQASDDGEEWEPEE